MKAKRMSAKEKRLKDQIKHLREQNKVLKIELKRWVARWKKLRK